MIVNGQHIEIKLSQRRKTLSIFIERNGSVCVLAPESLSKEEIKQAVKAKEYLIFKKLTKWKELNQGKVKREWVNGQLFMYLGRNYRLNLVEHQSESLLLKNGYFNLQKNKLDDAVKVFTEFYKKKGQIKIKERLDLFQKRFHKKPKGIKILDLQNRWASWTPNGNLNFHWKCMMAPVSVLDYIVVHELIHLKHPNHSKDFWDELEKLMPVYQENKKWLEQHGVKMDL